MVATSTDPNLGAIRLAWWRERLEEFDRGKPAPAEPRLQAVARELLSRGITGLELSRLEDAWLPFLQGEQRAGGLKLRGRILFGIGARLLGADAKLAEAPGELWSLVDGARHCGDPELAEEFLAEARSMKLPRADPRIRPLTVLAALAGAHALGRPVGFRRGLAAIAHRYRGTFPHS